MLDRVVLLAALGIVLLDLVEMAEPLRGRIVAICRQLVRSSGPLDGVILADSLSLCRFRVRSDCRSRSDLRIILINNWSRCWLWREVGLPLILLHTRQSRLNDFFEEFVVVVDFGVGGRWTRFSLWWCWRLRWIVWDSLGLGRRWLGCASVSKQ